MSAQFSVLAIDLEIEQLDWESICYKDGDVKVWGSVAVGPFWR